MEAESPRIRLGNPKDEQPMLELAMRAWDENGIKGVNPNKMLAMIKPALYLYQGLVGIIGEPGKKIEAAIVLRLSQMWYSDDWMIEEKAVFVDPEFRKPKKSNRSRHIIGHGRALCEFSKRVADELNVPLIIGVLSNHRTEAKVRLYEKHFGDPAGAFFLYNVKTGHNMTEH